MNDAIAMPPIGRLRKLWHRPTRPGLYWARQAGTAGQGELRRVEHFDHRLGVWGWQGGGAGDDFREFVPVEECCFEFWGPIDEPPPD